MRQHLSEKNVKKLRAQLNLPVSRVLVRGGTDHRQDLCLEDGSVTYYWPKTGEMEASGIGWDRKEASR